MSQSPAAEAARRRTFAIISHPDAGKTTLTETLLLFGGAIRAAGQVRARGENRRTRSDWMKIERERGISVSASVMTFDHDGLMFNLLDTPGHEDFSEDTYRTLTAADAAVMVLDAAKGIEPQTLKLFEVQKFVMLTGHMQSVLSVFVNERIWQGIPAGDRKIMEDTMAEVGARTLAWDKESSDRFRKELESRGMTFVEEKDGLDLAAFRKAVLDQIAKDFPEWTGYIGQIQAVR